MLSGRDASHRESVMHFEVDRPLTDDEREKLAARVKQILHDVRLVVRDFEPMQERVRHMIELARAGAVRYSPQEVGETVDFLEWLLQYNFVLLGYREYELVELDARAAGDPRRARERARHPQRCAAVGVRGADPALGVRSGRPRGGSRTATCWSSPRRTRTPPCTAARGWTTSACAS